MGQLEYLPGGWSPDINLPRPGSSRLQEKELDSVALYSLVPLPVQIERADGPSNRSSYLEAVVER